MRSTSLSRSMAAGNWSSMRESTASMDMKSLVIQRGDGMTLTVRAGLSSGDKTPIGKEWQFVPFRGTSG